MSSKTVWVEVTIVSTTPGVRGAVLVENAEEEKVWIPRSQIFDFTTDTFDELNDECHGHEAELEVSEWIAIEKGLA